MSEVIILLKMANRLFGSFQLNFFTFDYQLFWSKDGLSKVLRLGRMVKADHSGPRGPGIDSRESL